MRFKHPVRFGGKSHGHPDFLKERLVLFFFKQKTAYEIGVRLVGSEMCIRDRSILYISKRL